MAFEAWKDTGYCKECRRVKYCKKQCTANKKRIRKIAELSLRSAIGKVMIQNGARYADEARERLATFRREIGEDDSQEAVDTIFERCKKLAEQSRYTVWQIIDNVIGKICKTGESMEDVLNKIETDFCNTERGGTYDRSNLHTMADGAEGTQV